MLQIYTKRNDKSHTVKNEYTFPTKSVFLVNASIREYENDAISHRKNWASFNSNINF